MTIITQQMRDDDVKYSVSNQQLPNEGVGNYQVSSSVWKSNIFMKAVKHQRIF